MAKTQKLFFGFLTSIGILMMAGCASTPQTQYEGTPQTRYYGERNSKGLAHGQGKAFLPSGAIFEGEWKNGKRDGQGIERSANGAYKGEWKEDKLHGVGTYTWANGDKYVGEWKDGRKEGQGTMTYLTGDKYTGVWNQDKRHGQGVMTFPDGREPLGGIWENNILRRQQLNSKTMGLEDRKYWVEISRLLTSYPECTGAQTGWTDCFSIIRTSGETYTGTFRDGVYGGLGILAFPIEMQDVAWEDLYIGEFANGQRTGSGLYLAIVGEKLVQRAGIWRDGHLHQPISLEEFTNPELRNLVDNLVKKLTPKLEASLSQLKKAREEQEARRKEEERERLKKQKERERLEERLERERVQRKFQESYGPALEKCELLGFKKGTDKFADCVLRLSR